MPTRSRTDERSCEEQGAVLTTAQAHDPTTAYLLQLHAQRLAALSNADGIAPVLTVELDLAQAALDRAQCGEATAPAQAAHWCARAATGAAATLLAQRFADGELLLQWPDAPARVFTLDGARAPHGRLAPGRWVQALAAAWIVRDAVALAVLTDPDAIAAMFARLPPDLTPAEYRRPWCDSLAALERGTAVSVQSVQAAVQRDRTIGSAVDPQWQQADVLAVLPLVAAIAERDAEAAAIALAGAHTAHDHYERALRGHEPTPSSLLLTALHALAVDRGLLGAGDSPLAALIDGLPEARIGALAYRFARRAAAGAAEIHWFFDALGAPRAGREQRLEQRGEHLVARYGLPQWTAVPGAEAQFTLQDDARLLDPGQLLEVADRHASAVAATPAANEAALREQRLHLSEAVDCLTLALARIGAAEDVRPEQLMSAASRAAHAREPWRLRASALAAVRDQYRSLLAQVDKALAARSSAESGMRGGGA